MTTNDIDAIRREWATPCDPCDYGLPYECTCSKGDPRPIVSNLCEEIEKLRTALDDARQAVRRLVHMEREHLGSGRDGHLGERDLAPLLHALHIDPEETQ